MIEDTHDIMVTFVWTGHINRTIRDKANYISETANPLKKIWIQLLFSQLSNG